MSITGCTIHFGKVAIQGATNATIKKKPNGIFYSHVEAYYAADQYQALSKLCWNTKIEQFKILNEQGEILKDFHVWAMLVRIDTVLKVDAIITNHYVFKMLNKIK